MNKLGFFAGLALIVAFTAGCNGGDNSPDASNVRSEQASKPVNITSSNLLKKKIVSSGVYSVASKLVLKKTDTLTISKDAIVIIK